MGSYSEVWDLDSLFQGGSQSKEFKDYLTQLKEDIKLFETRLSQDSQEIQDYVDKIELLEDITKRLSEASAFISCLSAGDMNDTQAHSLVSERSALFARFANVKMIFTEQLSRLSDAKQAGLVKELPDIEFILNELVKEAEDRLPLEKETLINDLAVDGYKAWGEMYDTIVATLEVEIKGEIYSVGQASNLLTDPKRHVRKEAFNQLSAVWKENAPLFTQTLNHLAGFRLETYRHRKWDSVLKEPLEMNRMQEATLDAMWQTITQNKAPFVEYLERKASLLGLDKLSIFDVEAPLGESVEKVSYNEAAEMIISQFKDFSPLMAEFTEKAFEKGWIEAENRSGKRPGGFCTSFPDSKQTRIFMTFAETNSSVATLAHELGHAYHQHVMDDLRMLNQNYAMNVAETASTFAEMILADAQVKNAKTKAERIVLLDDKIQRSVAFFMDIHARFLFETRFYEERKQGVLSTARLNELMKEAQEEAYAGAVKDYNESFWASKLHFHITGQPFYNFPYTFGYLFSLGIYAEALEKGQRFEADYINLLKDTGRMTVEELAQKHLDVDLTQTDFWQAAVDLCIKDVQTFLELTK